MPSQFLAGIRDFFTSPDVAIDLGTANTRLFSAAKGLIADIPTAVKLSRRGKRLNSASTQVNGAGGKPEFVSPLRAGAVIDVTAASQLLKHLLKKAGSFGFIPPRVIICAPTNISERGRAALVEAARLAGVRALEVIPAPLAAAVGAGLDICSPYAQMIVDVGHGVTDIAVIREGNLLQTAATRVAGLELHNAVKKMVKERHRTWISEKAAEILTHKFAAVNRFHSTDLLKICGIDDYGRKISTVIESREISGAIMPIMQIIAATVNRVIQEMTPVAGGRNRRNRNLPDRRSRTDAGNRRTDFR